MGLGALPLGTAPLGAVLVFGAAGVTIYRPTSDVSVAGWTAVGAASVSGAIGEVTPSDAEYAQSPDLSTPAIVGTGSMPAGSYTSRIRAARVGGAAQIRVRYLNDSNVDVGGTDWQVLTDTPTTYSLPATLTGAATRKRIEVQ